MSLTSGALFRGKRHWSPFGSGAPPDGLQDESRYHSHLDFAAGAAAPAWVQRPSGAWVLEYDGTADYMLASNATTRQMDVITQKYTILCWVHWKDTTQSEILLGRYQLDVEGWEIYLTFTGGVYSLTQRHHHAGTIVDANPRSASFSEGWDEDTTWHMAVVYNGNGTDCTHYRNGVSLAITSSTGGIRDPEPCADELLAGIRYTKDANWYWGWHSPFLMVDYAMSQDEINKIYHSEGYLA